MKKLLCSCTTAIWILAFAIVSPVAAQVHTAKASVTINSNCKGFYEYLPSGYHSGSQQYPLLLFIHGLGELGDGSAAKLPLILRNGPPKLIQQKQWPDSFLVNGKQERFVVLSPQFIDWPENTDIDSLINYALSHYRIDKSRIYLTGLSMGGGVVWNYSGYSNTFARRIAAIVPICGASWPDKGRANIMAGNNLPVWATHNNGDPTAPVSYTNDYVTNINTSPKPPTPLARKTIFVSNSHDAWTATYNPSFREEGKNVYEWMLQYKRTFTYNWVGGSNTTWETAANWDNTLVPDANADVIINSGSVILKTNVTINSLKLGPGASLKVNPGYKLTVLH